MSNEWYTPAKYIEAAREVMGSIDLDPASCELANQTVRAARYYSKEDDGLSKAWYGNVWLNPPYGREEQPRGMAHTDPHMSIGKKWIDRLIYEYEAGNIKQAVLLGKADVKQVWFEPLWEFYICFAYNRVYFNRPVGPPERIMFGTVFVYLGPNEQKFVSIFSQFGRIARAVDVPVRSAVQQLEMVS